MTMPLHSPDPTPSRQTKRILFVDDEPRILQGTRRMLRGRRPEWEVATADSGAEALDKLASQPFDVVITDMRMPGMDGAELLVQVQVRFPDTVRIILSGHSDTTASLRSIFVAHQFVAKPIAAEDLLETLERALSLGDLIRDEKIRRVVGSVQSLPDPPRIYFECARALESPDSSSASITAIIEQDPSLVAKILQVANSAFFGLPQRTSDLEHAISYLGTETIKEIVLAVEALHVKGKVTRVGPIALDTIAELSVLAARLTKHLPAASREIRQQLRTAALLHDVGYLMLLEKDPEDIARTVELAEAESISFAAACRALSGPDPASVGAYLLGAWGLPAPVVAAVCDHDGGPQRFESSPTTRGVHIVDRAVKTALRELVGENALTRVTIDAEAMEQIGEATWQRLVDEAREAIEGKLREAA